MRKEHTISHIAILRSKQGWPLPEIQAANGKLWRLTSEELTAVRRAEAKAFDAAGEKADA